MYQISLIIPVYNVEKYIGRCLDSVYAQKNVKLQVICVDDCSKDCSKEIIVKYKDKIPYLELYENDRNRGLAYTRNAGMEKVEGEYTFFLDSDDCLGENCLNGLYIYAKENNLDALTYNSVKISENDIKLDDDFYIRGCSYEIADGIQMLKEFMENGDLVRTAWGTMYRTAFLKEQGIAFINGIYHEDLPFTFEAMIKAKRVGCRDDMAYQYRQHEKSITHSQNYEKLIAGAIEGYKKIKRLIQVTGHTENFMEVSEKYLEGVRNLIVGEYLEQKMIGGEFSKSTEDYILEEQIFEKENAEYYFSEEDYKKIVQYPAVSLYGAGYIAKRVYWILKELTNIEYIFVTKGKSAPEYFFGRKVLEWDKGLAKQYPIIVAVTRKYQREVMDVFSAAGFTNYVLVNVD